MSSGAFEVRAGRASTAFPVKHPTWDESHNLWHFTEQGRFIVWCQRAPNWLVFPPALFFHFFLKRDWGMAFGPFFAFVIYSDIRALDLFLAASAGGVLCGVLKHVIRSPRPFWIVPEVRLKEGVEEMSWGTPSAHSSIQGAIGAVLIYHDAENAVNWVVNIILLLFCMYSRLYLAVHWPQDVVLGAAVGIVAGLVVCASRLHSALVGFLEDDDQATAGLIFLTVGVGYYGVVWILVQLLNIISDRNPVPEEAILRYKLGVLRALRILKTKEEQEQEQESIVASAGTDMVDAQQKGVKVKQMSTMAIDESCPVVESEGEDKDDDDFLEDLDAEASARFASNMEKLKSLDPADHVGDGDRSMLRYGTMFVPLKEAEKVQDEEEHKRQEQGVFFRADIPFNPDSKVRFWYNAINVLGAYCGMAFFACLVSREDVEFRPNIKWLAALYAMSFSFAAIVYTRTIFRSVLPKKIFKWVRMFVYWFIAFYTYGLFPLSYLAVMHAS